MTTIAEVINSVTELGKLIPQKSSPTLGLLGARNICIMIKLIDASASSTCHFPKYSQAISQSLTGRSSSPVAEEEKDADEESPGESGSAYLPRTWIRSNPKFSMAIKILTRLLVLVGHHYLSGV